MSGVTVTMPMRDYQDMLDKIKHLEKQSVRNYISIEAKDIKENQFDRVLDLNAVNQDFGPLTFKSTFKS